MEAQLQELLEEVGRLDPLWAYGLLFLSAFLENVVPPVPGDTVVVFSAYLVGRGALGLWPVYLATCVGGLGGFMVMYYLGYSRGRAFFVGRRGGLLSQERLAQAEQWLERYGAALVLANRFLSGIRSAIAISAGIGQMAWSQVALLGLISLVVWNGLLLYAGLLVGQNWEVVAGLLKQYNRLLLLLLVLLGLLVAGRWWRKRASSLDRREQRD
jgi:membrane protein DedA with SNARE-associated domain